MLEVTDLGEMTKFLDTGVTYDIKDGSHLEQAQSIRDILTELYLKQANSTRTPIGEEQDKEDEGDLLPNGGEGTIENPAIKMVQSTIGSLLRLARCTRLDRDEPPKIILESYSDEDYSANRTDRKSVSGDVSFLNEMIAG